MNLQEMGSSCGGEKVLVALRASREIPKSALVWVLTHVVQPGDCITVVVVVPSQSSGRRLWGFPRFGGDCANAHKRSNTGTSSEQKCEISDSCSQMILQLRDVYDPNKIGVKIRVVSALPGGAVVAEAKKAQATWVVLDKDLKNEEKQCLEELHCNIVGMRRTHPKVLRLNLVGSPSKDPDFSYSEAEPVLDDNQPNKEKPLYFIRGPAVTPNGSPELFAATEAGASSVSSSDLSASTFFAGGSSVSSADLTTSPLSILDVNRWWKKGGGATAIIKEGRESYSETESESSTPCSSSRFQPWMPDYLRSQTQKPVLGSDQKAGMKSGKCTSEADFAANIREVISLSRTAPPGPPPLCSICQHKAPVFGKPPRWFSYAELEHATNGFSQNNFLAEGGYGSVHRGVLTDGQAIAVKQHKLASSQGDVEFCSEVEVLSCAQHRNLVMLIGYCIEDKRRLLVYEYICNGSLDSHLYGHTRAQLEWYARQKIAVGAARGLRYLHEECRVGCIVHRDMRPNNILLTHDYEPLVGDFGLARWQPDGDTGVQTRVIGTFGYLAPEYAQSGQITEKADVYSFGVVLVELITGRKAVDLGRPKGQQCLTEWVNEDLGIILLTIRSLPFNQFKEKLYFLALKMMLLARPLLEEYAIDELIDPRLSNNYLEQEVNCMICAASLCIRRDPHSRPRMSQVLRILEGDMLIDSGGYTGYDGNRSGRLRAEEALHRSYSGSMHKEESEVYAGGFSFDSVRAALWAGDKARAS